MGVISSILGFPPINSYYPVSTCLHFIIYDCVAQPQLSRGNLRHRTHLRALTTVIAQAPCPGQLKEKFWGWGLGICRILKVPQVILMYSRG